VIVLAKPSPNFNDRPVGRGAEIIVLHGTAGRTDAGDLSWLQSPKSRVSYHYVIGRDGAIYQLVQESKRAWHAGKSRYQGHDDCNDFSIGVALCNKGTDRSLYDEVEPYPEPYTDAQYAAAARVVADIHRRRGIGLKRVVGHADVSPGRKTDPWNHFDWNRFRKEVIDLLHPPPEPFTVPLPRAA
jgi:N-acetylmuramoyl-L-alanine amidase